MVFLSSLILELAADKATLRKEMILLRAETSNAIQRFESKPSAPLSERLQEDLQLIQNYVFDNVSAQNKTNYQFEL